MHDENGQPEADATWVFECEPSRGLAPLQTELRGRRLIWKSDNVDEEGEKTFEECCLLLEHRFKECACECCVRQPDAVHYMHTRHWLPLLRKISWC